MIGLHRCQLKPLCEGDITLWSVRVCVCRCVDRGVWIGGCVGGWS